VVVSDRRTRSSCAGAIDKRLRLAEVTRVRGDDEQQAAERKCEARDQRPTSGKLERRNLCGSEPDSSEQDEQVADFCETQPRVAREGKDKDKDKDHASHSRDVGADLSRVE
jgi:hypothetical protein